MTLSTLTYYGGDIPDGSNATPGLWDRRFSAISQNLDQLNTDAGNLESDISTSRLTITTTLAGAPAATMLYKTNTNDAVNGIGIYRSQSNGTTPPDAEDVLGYIILGGANGAGGYRNEIQFVGYAEGTWGASAGAARAEFRVGASRVLSLTSSAVSSHISMIALEPTASNHVATKNYVDNKVSSYTGAVAASISAGSVTDGSFSGEYQFSRATSALTIAGDVTGLKQYVANTVGPVYPAFVGSQRSFGFGFSASNNYPMVTMSGVTQALWDSTILHVTSDISTVNSGGRIRVGNGSVTTCPIAVGTDDNAGWYYDAALDELRGVALDLDVLRLNGQTSTTPTVYVGVGTVRYPTLTFESSSTIGYPRIYFVASSGTYGSFQYDAANAELEVQLGKGASSIDSEIAKFTHPSTISATGLWLYDGASGSVTPVEVLGNDTAATGYRALALANV